MLGHNEFMDGYLLREREGRITVINLRMRKSSVYRGISPNSGLANPFAGCVHASVLLCIVNSIPVSYL